MKNHIYVDSMFNDISCDKKDNEEECLANVKVVSILAKKFGIGQWSFIGPGSEKKWDCISEDSPQGVWDNMAEKMLLEFAESGWPGRWSPQGMSTTGGGGLARVPNLRVAHAGGEG